MLLADVKTTAGELHEMDANLIGQTPTGEHGVRFGDMDLRGRRYYLRPHRMHPDHRATYHLPEATE